MERRWSIEEIVDLLQKQESGYTIAQLCREHNVKEVTFYLWKAQYGGMSVAVAQQYKQLKDENGKLKRMVRALNIENSAIKDQLAKGKMAELTATYRC